MFLYLQFPAYKSTIRFTHSNLVCVCFASFASFSFFTFNFCRCSGDLGGQIGLVLGASCISIVEALDVFAVSLYYWIRHRRMKGNKDNLNV